jgi:hypothetical protein
MNNVIRNYTWRNEETAAAQRHDEPEQAALLLEGKERHPRSEARGSYAANAPP